MVRLLGREITAASLAPDAVVDQAINRALARLKDPKYMSRAQGIVEQTQARGVKMLIILSGISSYAGMTTDTGEFLFLGRTVEDPTCTVIVRPCMIDGKHYGVKELLYAIYKEKIPYMRAVRNGGVDMIAKDGKPIFHATNARNFFLFFMEEEGYEDLAAQNFK